MLKALGWSWFEGFLRWEVVLVFRWLEVLELSGVLALRCCWFPIIFHVFGCLVFSCISGKRFLWSS